MADFYGKLIVSKEDERHQEFVLSKGSITLGRSTVHDVVLDDELVSRSHARVDLEKSGFVLHDLGSVNGTLVNGVRVESKVLSHGDVIQLGNTTLHFETGALPVETDITSLASAGDLETAIKRETMPVMVGDNQAPSLVVIASGKTWQVPFAKEALTIGRHPENDIVLNTPMASRAHARIERRQDDFILRDLNSRNGTWVNDAKVTEQTLRGGEAIRIGPARLIFKRGFSSEDLTDLTSPAGRAEPRPVVIVPGLLGSELWLGSERIFPNIKVLISRPEILRLPGDHAVEVRDVVNEVVIVPNVIKLDQYNRLGNYLVDSLGYERGKNLLEFGYDWRQDNRISARRLAEAIEQWQARSSHARRPVTIIAHSNGALVSRYYTECLGGAKTVERIVFMGAPHYGSPKMIASLLIGPDMLPFGLMGERLRQVLATYPSAYQVLPTYNCVVDQAGENVNVLLDENWVAEEQRPFIRDARRFRKELGARSSVPSISIFGYGFGTVTRVVVERDAQKKWGKADCQETPGGDAAVPEPSAMLKGSEIHPVRQYHGSLYTDNDVKMRLRLELTQNAPFRAE